MSTEEEERELLGLNDNGEPKQPEAPVLAPTSAVARLLSTAAGGADQRDRDQLMADIVRLEKELDDSDEEKREIERQRRQAVEELEKFKRIQNIRKKKVDEAEAAKRDADLALAHSIRGKDVRLAREEREQKDADELREEISMHSRLHPDYQCEECGPRVMGDIMKCDGSLKKAKFKTMRELAALIDVASSGEKLQPFEVMRVMQDKADARDTSVLALKKAYRKGICEHALEDAEKVQQAGIYVKGEEGDITDALNEVLCVRGGRVSRRSYVLCVPSDSVVARLNGGWKTIEEQIYEDEEGLEKMLHSMDTGSSLPKNLIILLKNAMSPTMLKKLKAYIMEVVKRIEITIYIGADILPKIPSSKDTAAVVTHHLWLASWKLENPSPKIVIISQFSATVWSMIPLINVFVVARSETKELFESALMHIIEGKQFPFPDNAIRPEASPRPRGGLNSGFKKRRFNPDDAGPSTAKTCYNCRRAGHFAHECTNPRYE